MAAKVPAPKIIMSATFSLVGRLISPSVLMGSARIHKSVMILIPEVAAHTHLSTSFRPNLVQSRRRLTVEEGRRIYAEAPHHAGKIPHFA